MFGDSSQDVFSAVSFFRAEVFCTSGEIISELAFVLGMARNASMKVMTVPKLELKVARCPFKKGNLPIINGYCG